MSMAVSVIARSTLVSVSVWVSLVIGWYADQPYLPDAEGDTRAGSDRRAKLNRALTLSGIQEYTIHRLTVTAQGQRQPQTRPVTSILQRVCTVQNVEIQPGDQRNDIMSVAPSRRSGTVR